MAEKKIDIGFPTFDRLIQQIKTIRDEMAGTTRAVASQASKDSKSLERQYDDAGKAVERYRKRITKTVDAADRLRTALQRSQKWLGAAAPIVKAGGAGPEILGQYRQMEAAAKVYGARLDMVNATMRRHAADVKAAEREQKRLQKAMDGGGRSMRNLNKETMDFNKRLGIAIQKIITYRLAFGAFRQATQMFRELLDVTIQMDSVMGDLEKVLQTNTATMDMLTQEAITMAKEYGRSIVEVADSFRIFAQQGLEVNEILERTNAVMLLTSASTMETSEAVEALTAVVKSYPEFVNDATAAVDKWAAVQARAPVTARDLANAMKNVGIVASQAGVSLDELNGFVAATAEVTRESGKFIGNAFKTIFARFPRSTTIKALQDLGVAALKDNQTMRDFGDVMRDLSKRWSELEDVQKKQFAQQIGGIRRFQVFMALMENFDRFMTSAADSQFAFGEAERMAGIETEKYKRQLLSLQASLHDVGLAIGESGLLQDLINLARKGIELTKKLKENAEAVYGVVKAFTLWGARILAVYGTVAMITKVIIPLIGYIKAAGIAAYGAAQGVMAFGVASKAALSAIGPIGVALAAVSIALTLVKTKAKEAGEEMGEFNQFVAEGIGYLEEHAQRLKEVGGNYKEIEEAIERVKMAEMTVGLNEQREAFDEIARSYERQKSVITDFSKAMSELDMRAPTVTIPGTETAWEKNLRERLEALTGKDIPAGELERTIDSLNAKFAAQEDQMAFRVGLAAVGGDASKLNDEMKELGISMLKYQRETAIARLETEQTDLQFKAMNESLSEVERQKADLALQGVNAQLKFLKDNEITVDDIFGADADDALFKITKHFSELEKKLGEIFFDFQNIDKVLARDEALARRFGESFAAAKEKISLIDNVIEATQSLITTRMREQAGLEAEIADIDERILGILRDMAGKPLGDIMKAMSDINVDSDELEKHVTKLLKLWAENAHSIDDAKEALKDFVNAGADARKVAQQVSVEQQKMRVEAEIVSANYGMQIAALKTQYSGYRKLSSVRALDAIVAEKIVNREIEIENLAYKQARAKLEAKIASEKLEKTTWSVVDAEKAAADLQLLQINHEKRLNEIRMEGVEQIYKRIDNVKQELSGSISSSLAGLPGAMADRRMELEEIHARRVELERELADAVEANDQAAINSARNAINELEHELRGLKPVWLDLFSNVGDIFMQKQMERFVDQVLGMGAGHTWGQQFAEIVTGESLKWADNMRQAMLEVMPASTLTTSLPVGGKAGAAGYRAAGEFSLTGEVEAGMRTGSDIAANRLINAFDYGSTLLSSMLVDPFLRVLGKRGAGQGAATGSQIGQMFGRAAGTTFLGILGAFAGPVGGLLGSLFGGLLGSSFDQFPDLTEDLSEEVEKNTQAIENNTRQLKLQNQFINAPASYVAPPAGGTASGGGNTYVFNVNGAQNPTATADAIRNIMNDEYGKQVRTISSQSRRFGR